jgi:hypothetical protein
VMLSWKLGGTSKVGSAAKGARNTKESGRCLSPHYFI